MEKPLLQIIHYTDMHLASDGYIDTRWQLKRLYPRLSHEWQQGWAGPQRAVLNDFIRLIEDLKQGAPLDNSEGDPAWADRPTWLVDTGDGTTFGDLVSLQEWRDWSDSFEQAAKPHGRLMRVYGNHDAWPGIFPPFEPNLQLAMNIQRNMLRKKHFPACWPEPPWTVSVPGTPTPGGAVPSQVELCVVNTVDHDVVLNTLAVGVAARDWHWARPLSALPDTPADDLATRALAQPGGQYGRHLRIVAMHYPVANDATPGSPRWQKVLANRKRFAQDLQGHRQVKPLVAHLLLAGHTHMAFPGVGQLPPSASAATHTPLVAGQCQVVSASLSQAILPGSPLKANETWAESRARLSPYQCTVLRFYSQDHDPFEIIMDRAIAGADDTGIFSFLPLAPGSHQTVERMTFRL